jgi:predicted Zn-dependent peptidase
LQTAENGGLVRRTTLPSGLRIVTEAMPGVRSAAVGVWVGVGSRDETPALGGAAHFLEHLLFKGTRRRDALEISASLEAVGGDMNAFTNKEYTAFYARVLDVDLALAIDVLGDMLTDSIVRTSDVDSERHVVLEEIAMHEDEPSDAVHELFTSSMYAGSTIGLPIIGTRETITNMSRSQVHGFWRRRYRPEVAVVSVAGNVDHNTVVRLVKKSFDNGGWIDGIGTPEPPRATAPSTPAAPGVYVTHRKTEQAHLVLGVPGIGRDDDRRYAMGVLNAALGGAMSSRLFQEVREKRGLAYSVYSFISTYSGAGALGVSVGSLPKRVPQVIEVVRETLADVATHGITDEELQRGKGQLRGASVLSMEDSGSRMTRIGKNELLLAEHPTLAEVIERVDEVTPDDVKNVAQLWLQQPSLAVIGPFADDDSKLRKAIS